MQKPKHLPHIENIRRLARIARPYPASVGEIKDEARFWGIKKSTIDFLNEFPDNEIFENPGDLIERCYDLEVLMSEEKDLPKEFLRSPQD